MRCSFWLIGFIRLKDIAAILDRLVDLPTEQGFAPGSKLYVYQEVIDFDDEAIKVTEYYDTGPSSVSGYISL